MRFRAFFFESRQVEKDLVSEGDGLIKWTGMAALAMWIAAPPSAARAQTATPPSPPVTAGWQDGFFLQSANGENRLVLGLTAQFDARFPLDDQNVVPATFTIRKARPTFSGRIAKYFDFKLMPDFGAGAATLLDAYFDLRLSPKFRIRTGKGKTPVGYELLQGDPYLLFPERTLASALVPNRDVGIQVQGDLSPRFSYSAGVFNGIPDGISSVTDVDTNGAKDVAGRLVWQPFHSTATPTGPLNGLGFHLGGSTGKQAGPLSAFRTLAGQTYFSYLTDATAAGTHNRITPAIFYYYKSFGGFAEYVRSTYGIVRSDTRTDITNQAWEVTGSYVLTGEPASDRGIHPTHNFDPADGKWGAFQVAARYSELRIDPLVFNNGLATSTTNHRAGAFGAVLNWYPNSFLKYYATYETTSLRGGPSPRREHVLLFRAQLAF